MLESLALVIGAAISAVVALVVVQRQHRLERDAGQHQRRSEQLAQYFAAAHAAVLAIGELARAPMVAKAALNAKFLEGTTDRVNTGLAQLRLLEPSVVVDAAMSLDRSMVDLHKKSRAQQWTSEEWRMQQQDLTQSSSRSSRASCGGNWDPIQWLVTPHIAAARGTHAQAAAISSAIRSRRDPRGHYAHTALRVATCSSALRGSSDQLCFFRTALAGARSPTQTHPQAFRATGSARRPSWPESGRPRLYPCCLRQP